MKLVDFTVAQLPQKPRLNLTRFQGSVRSCIHRPGGGLLHLVVIHRLGVTGDARI